MQEANRRIAVVCVHGVADQAPSQTSGAVARLLQLLPGADGARPYGAFTERVVTVVPEPPTHPGSDPPPTPRLPSLRSPFIRSLDDSKNPFRDESDDIRFTAELCRYHQIDAGQDAFTTRVLSGSRADGNGSVLQIDLLEMYWADLSRLGTGPLAVLGGLYQLLVHLMGAGRDTLGLAAHNSRSRLVGLAAWLHAFATWIFQFPVVLLNVLLLLLAAAGALATLLGGLDDVVKSSAAILFSITMLILALSGLATWSRKLWLGYAAVPVIILLMALVLSNKWLEKEALFFPELFLLELLCVVGFVYYRTTLIPYKHVRPGSQSVGLVMLFMPLAAVLYAQPSRLEPAPEKWPQYDIARYVTLAETVYLAVEASWMFYLVPAMLVAVLFLILFLAYHLGSNRATAANASALATGLVLLMVPPSLLLSTLLAIWSVLNFLLESVLGGVPYEPLFFDYWAPVLGDSWNAGEPGPLANFLESIVINSAGSGFDLFFVTVTATAAILMLGLMPSARCEKRHTILAQPRRWLVPKAARRSCHDGVSSGADGAHAGVRGRAAGHDNDASQRLGDWLDRGLRLATPAFVVLAIGAYVVLPVSWGNLQAAKLGYDLSSYLPYYVEEALTLFVPSSGFLPALGSILALLGIAWLALGGGIAEVVRRMRPVLDVVLDVDNWLRNHPVNRTVRARIVARFAALLHHVAVWQDENGKSYDGVVIVAHSQGSVVVAETLRFARLAPEGCLGPHLQAWRDADHLKTRLLTVGSPLRQLYGWCFPYLYRWARHDGDGRERCDRDRSWPIPDNRRPDPRGLGVELWVNAYCSGDYVGRYLWRPDQGDGRWVPWLPVGDGQPSLQDLALSHDGNSGPIRRVELCLGTGAHTRYLDPDDGARVARLMDWLIVQPSPVSAGQGQEVPPAAAPPAHPPVDQRAFAEHR